VLSDAFTRVGLKAGCTELCDLIKEAILVGQRPRKGFADEPVNMSARQCSSSPSDGIEYYYLILLMFETCSSVHNDLGE
jgi:hypothetical protein